MAEKSRLVDLNALAIYLTENHPGNPYISAAIDAGLDGQYRLFVPDYSPLRARWILTKAWKVPKQNADEAIQDFLGHPRVGYLGASRTALLRAFELAKSLGHDVYDTFYLAMALDHSITGLLTTDTDFRALAPKVGLEYENPVPADVLAKFGVSR
ncbi:MAG: type II toxin-antitoxin system VapC family toxin [Thermoplasmatota archaeon]